MQDYFIAEISGKQYRISPDKQLIVDYLGEIEEFACEKILLKSSGGKLEIGTPFLKEKVVFAVQAVKLPAVRVATFKSKANYRRVIGQARRGSKLSIKK